jgi:hypothetical protein
MKAGDTFFDDLTSCLRNDDMTFIDLSSPDGKENVVQALRFLVEARCFNYGQASLDTPVAREVRSPLPRAVRSQPRPVGGGFGVFPFPPPLFGSSTTSPAAPPAPVFFT